MGNSAGSFEVILMDVMMPVMNGIEATKAIRLVDRSDARMIPMIAMTANAFDGDRQATKNTGMNWHIAKPIQVETLMSALTEILKEQIL